VASSVRNIGLPEVAIGLIPGWGGSFLLPNLIGIEKAIEVVLTNPLANNKQLTAAAATKLGIIDIELSYADFLAESLRWNARVLSDEVTPKNEELESAEVLQAAVSHAGGLVEDRLHSASPTSTKAVELLALAGKGEQEKSLTEEDAS